MSVFEDLDELQFVAIEPAGPKPGAECRVSFIQFRDGGPKKLQIVIKATVIDEIGGPRFDIAWHAPKRLILIKAGPQARFEAVAAPRGISRMLRFPPPPDLHPCEGTIEPEFYVDRIGKRILVELPQDFGRRLALPAPFPKDAPVPQPAAPKRSEVEEGNRDILRALGVTGQFPRELRGVKFTPPEAKILEALYRGKELTLEALLAATHSPEHGDDERNAKTVDVWLTKMRPKLAHLDLAVKTIWGGRRTMDAASKGRLRQMLQDVEGSS